MSKRIFDNITELIGGTPLIRVNRMNPAPEVELLVKLESMNPGGSVKDRIGLHMIEAAERSGELRPGRIILEASSGNTAIGLAMVAVVKGYRLMVTMAESASEERKKILRAYGVEIRITPGELGTDGAIEEAYRLAREEPETYFLIDQYNNEANWLAHVERTGPEIWEDTQGEVDVVVTTMGTTGTLMGLTRYMKGRPKPVRVVGVEPYKGHKIQGLKNMKESYPPGIFDPSEPDAIVNVDDDAAYETARRLARDEGILVGMSAGAAMRVAMDEAVRLGKGTIVVMLPDTGERYLSTSLFAAQCGLANVMLHNTRTRELESLRTVRDGHVGIYTCGPSLDGPPGLGLIRRMLLADLLRRHLVSRGYSVKHVVNLGDIDDRTVNECLKSGGNIREFTGRWEKVFFEDMERMRILRAHQTPRASEHVPDMVAETKALMDKGLAYEKLRSVYYNIRKFDGYGKLSRVNLAKTKPSATTAYDYYEKENPKDFSLFKRSSLAELKAGIYWSTPWGNSRPGWHCECATMARKYLGQPFDIHTAGTDLLFPHGDNEIAIAEGLAERTFANYWLHTEIVTAEGRKVGRGENQITLRDLLEQGWSARVVRYWMLSTHYRKVLTFSTDELHNAQEALSRVNALIARLQCCLPGGKRHEQLDQALYEARSGFFDKMDQDLNVPRALAHLFGLVREVHKMLDQGCLDRVQADRILAFLREVDNTLAIFEFESNADDCAVKSMVLRRDEARRKGDWAEADSIRAALAAEGIELIDSKEGTHWRRK